MTPITTPNYRMPAEWEPHAATWLSWAHNPDNWPGMNLPEQIWVPYVQMIAALARSEPVYINVNDDTMATTVQTILAAAGVHENIHLVPIPTNFPWCRDHGTIFVQRTPAAPSHLPPLRGVVWQFNAWGSKYPLPDDSRAAARMATEMGVDTVAGGMVLEGGAIDVNGAGTLLTTESCLLNPNRNPHMNKAAIEERLKAMLGVSQIIWLGEGIAGDDTDGHVDDITRFVAPDTVLTVVSNDPDDSNYAPLQANLRRLRAARDQNGKRLRVRTLPMPPPITHNGERLPASYANFYIANRVVLLPTFGASTDATAQQVVQACFPEREVVPIDCHNVVWGLGACHCLTQQVPTATPNAAMRPQRT